MRLLRKILPFLFLTLTCIVFIHLFYGHVLHQPGSVLFRANGDGLKNYFTYAWHAEHDQDPLHFGGSGHPFGDHVFFADAHPLMGWTVKLLSIPEHLVIGILNLILLASLLLTCWALYALLRYFSMQPWAAALGAFSIMLLQPQLFRLGGHLSLVHAWFVPLGWFLMLRSLERPGVIWAVLATLTSIAAYLTHPYLGLMLGFFQGVFLLIYLMQHRSVEARDVLYPVKSFAIVVVPVVVFFFLMNASDVIPDRPSTPQGGDEFHTRWSSLLLPTHEHFEVFGLDTDNFDEPPWETVAYLGIPSIIILPITLLIGIYQIKRGRRIRSFMDILSISFTASVVVLLFAFGVHKIFSGHITFLDQFRSTGRFAWVFWYACAVFSLVRLHQYLFEGSTRGRIWPVLTFCMVTLIYAWEGLDQHVKASNYYGHYPNLFLEEHASSELNQLVFAAGDGNYDGLIPLPLPIIGSEYYERDLSDGLLQLALPLSYRVQLPLMACITSRTSLSQTRSLLALISPPAHPKDLKELFPDDAQFLLVWSGEELDEDEQALLDRSELLMRNEAGGIHRISAVELFNRNEEALLQTFRSMKYEAQVRNGVWYSVPATTDHSSHAQVVHLIDMEIEGHSNEYTTLLELPPNTLRDISYELSFIIHWDDPAALITTLVMEDHSEGPTDNKWRTWTTLARSPMQYNDRAIIKFQIHPADTTRYIKFFLKGKDSNAAGYNVTDVMLRPKDLDVWREGEWFGEPNIFWNNIPIKNSARAYEAL